MWRMWTRENPETPETPPPPPVTTTADDWEPIDCDDTVKLKRAFDVWKLLWTDEEIVMFG